MTTTTTTATKTILVEDPSEFDRTLKSALEQYTNVLVYFGAPWCPDCMAAKPDILEMIASLDKDRESRTVFMDCDVKREPYKAPDAYETYPYRKDQRLKLTNIPTLIVWKREEDGLQRQRLEDWRCGDEQELENLKQKWIA